MCIYLSSILDINYCNCYVVENSILNHLINVLNCSLKQVRKKFFGRLCLWPVGGENVYGLRQRLH